MAGRFEGTIVINRPIEEVFAFLADGENDPKFSPRVLEIAKTTEYMHDCVLPLADTGQLDLSCLHGVLGQAAGQPGLHRGPAELRADPRPAWSGANDATLGCHLREHPCHDVLDAPVALVLGKADILPTRTEVRAPSAGGVSAAGMALAGSTQTH